MIVGDGDDEVSEMTGREWERQGEQDPDEELSGLPEEYLLESMMAEENDGGNQDEETLLGNEGSESGEQPSTFDPEDSEVHSEEYGESNGRDGQSRDVFCEQLEDVMMGLETKNENANANPAVEESQGVAQTESSEGAALGRSKQTIKAPGRLIDEKNVLCIEKTKIGWKEFLIKVYDEALKTINMDELIKWKENVVARENILCWMLRWQRMRICRRGGVLDCGEMALF
jgi:hypothetical protein